MVNVRHLSEFFIHTQHRRSGLSHPTEDQIKDLCRQYKIDGDKVMTLIGEMRDDIHTIVIDADKFNKYTSEKRCRWCNKLIYFEDNPKYPDDFWAHVETNLMKCGGVYGYAEPHDET